MKTIGFYDYIPQRYASNEINEQRVRNFIYAFKRGERKAVDYAVTLVSDALTRWYGVGCQDIALCCIPASDNCKYVRRCKRFAQEVSKRTGIINGTKHVNIFGQREAKHNNDNHMVNESVNYAVSTDPAFFIGKRVIVFDDVITTGNTAEDFAEELKEVGADVIGGLFLARTKMINKH